MLVTGLSHHECHDRFAALFGQCASDMQRGAYDDAVRQRANVWRSASIELACVQKLAARMTTRIAVLRKCPRFVRAYNGCAYDGGNPCECASQFAAKARG
jgi:hypothetical protein